MAEIHIYQLGDLVTVYGCTCRVIKIHPFGTYDVERLTDGRCFRLTGLTRYAVSR